MLVLEIMTTPLLQSIALDTCEMKILKCETFELGVLVGQPIELLVIHDSKPDRSVTILGLGNLIVSFYCITMDPLNGIRLLHLHKLYC